MKFTQPKHPVPFCAWCDDRLYAGGRCYVLLRDPLGHVRPFHKECTTAAKRSTLYSDLESGQ